jgi:hypothetical protein
LAKKIKTGDYYRRGYKSRGVKLITGLKRQTILRKTQERHKTKVRSHLGIEWEWAMG